jgi:hypothetical protein
MRGSVHRSFGLTAVITSFDKGGVVTVDPLVNNTYSVGPNFGYIFMHLKGTDVLINTVTGEEIARGPGDNSITSPMPLGEWRSTSPEDIEVVCYSPFINADKVPLNSRLEPVVLNAGESKLMPHLTQFFLAAGDIQINGKTISGPKQVHMKTGDVTMNAVTNTYGFIVR